MHEDRTPESPEMRAAFWNAIFMAAIDERTPMIRVCGYDPRFLLTDGRLTSLWDAQMLAQAYRNSFPELSAIWNGLNLQHETIDFDPQFRDETVLLVDSEGTVQEVQTFRVPVERRNLTPFVSPIGPRDPDTLLAYSEESGEPITGTPTGRFKTYSLRDVRLSFPRIERPKLDGFIVDIESYSLLDFKTLEDHVLETLQRKRDYQMEMYRQAFFGVEMGESYDPFLRRQPPEPEVKQNGRSAAYLRHDKSKSHKRRKRK